MKRNRNSLRRMAGALTLTGIMTLSGCVQIHPMDPVTQEAESTGAETAGVTEAGATEAGTPEGAQSTEATTEQVSTAEPTTEAKKQASKSFLDTWLTLIGKTDLSCYENREIIDPLIAEAKEIFADPDATQEDVDRVAYGLRDTFKLLNDGSNLPRPQDVVSCEGMPDPYIFADGTAMTGLEQWPERQQQIATMYQYYMYGYWRDGSDEKLTYDYDAASGKLTIHVERISTGAKASFTATVKKPDASKAAPEGGYPVIVGMHAYISENTAWEGGYATITLDMANAIASDDTAHKGAFYDLYPYGGNWKEQTGVLMAWSWGCSKILDALEAGLAEETNISPVNTIVTGVSRYGKAAAVCGAFEKRFKMAAPSCSGAGGLALYRYTSQGKTYDFTSKGAPAAYTYGANEPISSLQSAAERGWFNDAFSNFGTPEKMPAEQYMLPAVAADPDRYYFIIGSCISEDWVNAPSMWTCYLGAKSIYDTLGLSDHLAINIHKEGHAVIAEDVEYMMQYFNYHVYGIEPTMDLKLLQTSVFAEPANADPAWDEMFTGWTKLK